MRTRFFLLLLVFFYSFKAFSTNIRVIDFQKIIESSTSISFLYGKINEDQEIHNQKFKNEELVLQKELERIQKLDLILDPAELNEEVENYNKKLNNFNSKIETFNLHYDLQINNLKNDLINIILEILKKYSEDNKIDLILDSNNYILSTNSINITDVIKDQVNKKEIEINFEKY